MWLAEIQIAGHRRQNSRLVSIFRFVYRMHWVSIPLTGSALGLVPRCGTLSPQQDTCSQLAVIDHKRSAGLRKQAYRTCSSVKL